MAQDLDALHAQNPNVGADCAALALRALSKILEECRVQRLTRHQHVTFKLGELIACAEVARAFSQMAAQKTLSDCFKFDRETYTAMARVNAKTTAFDVASQGIKLVVGAGEGDATALAQSVEFGLIEQKQNGTTADMDFIAAKLNEALKK
ncbi:MAG: acyl-CoA dehydrogenase family protein [Elusimicrobia bacterium]|nr:acyl-CoA dehydrogenase family protein [Elusimicrobiota bacterium]